MSHFTVGVIITKERYENECKKYFISELDGSINERAISKLVDESLVPFDENLECEPYVLHTTEEIFEKYKEVTTYEGDSKHKLNLKERYSGMGIDEFVNRYYCADFDKEKGIISTYNKKAKWDWYVIGGRWGGALGFDKDYARIKDISFTKTFTEEEIKKLREEYEESLVFDYYTKKYPTFEVFLKDESVFSTYALLDSNGEWFEPGEILPFGISNSTYDEELQFTEFFKEKISTENPESYFVLVDCHI